MNRRALFAIFCVILCVLMFYDGVITYWGITTCGIHLEGNPLLKTFMNWVGVAPALFLIKLLSIMSVGWLYWLGVEKEPFYLLWMCGLLIIWYIGLSVIPWTVLFLT